MNRNTRLCLFFLLTAVAGVQWTCGEPASKSSPQGARTTARKALPPAEVRKPQAATPKPVRGLWVLCEGSARVLEAPERIDALITDAISLAATDLFVQVYRGGRAWFDSSEVEAGPYAEIIRRTGEDPLSRLLMRAHAAGLRVHAWVNVFSLANRRDATLLNELGRDAAAVDHMGRSVLDYPNFEVPEPDRRYYRMGTPALWLDPAAPGVAEKLTTVFADLVARYPTLDGLHLDYFRYPDVLPFSPGARFGVGLHFGYGAPTRERFQRETSLEAPFGTSLQNADRWDDWRRDRMTQTLARLRGAVHAVRPQLLLSAAVWAYADRAYLSIFQDWRRWLEEGWLDFAVPMLYTKDDQLFREIVRAFAGEPNAARIWIGLGSWLFASEPQRALAQVKEVRAAGNAGHALFSYDALAEHPKLREALASEVKREF